MDYKIRFATLDDAAALKKLYKLVAKKTGGIAREESEITNTYIVTNIEKSILNGLCFVIENPNQQDELLAEIHCYKPEPKVFNHILSDLTIIVHLDFQGQGLGKLLFTYMLSYVEKYRNDILRIELIVRESNTQAISFYHTIGFNKEGTFKNRIANHGGNFEADIPMAWFNPNYNK